MDLQAHEYYGIRGGRDAVMAFGYRAVYKPWSRDVAPGSVHDRYQNCRFQYKRHGDRIPSAVPCMDTLRSACDAGATPRSLGAFMGGAYVDPTGLFYLHRCVGIGRSHLPT